MRTDLTAKEIVNFIKSNPGCIKRLYSPEDRSNIDETELLIEDNWKCNYDDVEERNWVEKEFGTAAAIEEMKMFFENDIVSFADGIRAYCEINSSQIIFEET